MPAGARQLEAAKSDGRWDNAYDSPKNITVPEDFMKLLIKNKRAHDFYTTLTRANIYAIAWRLQTAKRPETRNRWVQRILKMLSKGETFH